MTNRNFQFYSVLKNEDANPYIGDNILVVADGLGGSGSAVHTIDRAKHADMHGDIIASAFGDMKEVSPKLKLYIEDLIAPMVDGKDDTSALWASRIVIARCVYALVEGEFKKADLSDKKVRAKLAEFIGLGLHEVVKKFDLQKGKYDGQLLLPTTLAFIRHTETKDSVIAETVWAGDSRCYALTPNGLKLLSVDDEDNSGSITNLFYADNSKATLNFIHHEIAKPCVLLAVSDGIFDPFDPHENLGVEHTLLSAIKENNTPQELATALYDFYESVHGDDATMAFVPIGFGSFEDMQEKLARRTDDILAVRKKQGELYGALEVMNQSEEDASHYVIARTNDRYDYIAPILVDAIERGTADIALTPEVRKIAETVKKDCVASAEKERRQNREQALAELYNYVKTHPELVSQIFVPCQKIDFKTNYNVEYAFSDLWKYAADYVATVNNEALKAMEAELRVKSEALHQRITERISFYRKQFDDIWGDKISDYKLRYNTKRYLSIWQDIDFDLQYNWGVSNIGDLTVEDRPLAYEVRDCIDECKKVKGQIKAMKSNGENLYRNFITAWNTVCNYLKNCPAAITVLLTPEAAQRFGVGVSDESFIAELGKNNRSRILSELKTRKAVIVSDIVNSLADNYDKTSVIDGQFNGTKLELFRTYFRLKASDRGELEGVKARLAAIEKAYTEFIF